MNLNKIISEEINRFLVNEIFYEDSNNDTTKRNFHSKSDDQIEKEKKRDGNALNSEDESEIRNIVNSNDLINVAALARKVFPDHTPEGAQSQLRKQLKGETNDTGKEYHIKQRVGQEIRKQLQKL